MTCIVAIVEGNEIWMGCDSFAGDTHYHLLLPEEETKMFCLTLPVVGKSNEAMVFGFCGQVRPCQVIKHNLKLPICNPEEITSNMNYMINHLIPDMKTIHKKHGLLLNNQGIERTEALFLVGWRSKLFYIEEDFGVTPVSTNYIAMGSGEITANGSLHATANSNLKPQERLEMALTVAENNTNFVRKPFYYQHIVCQ